MNGNHTNPDSAPAQEIQDLLHDMMIPVEVEWSRAIRNEDGSLYVDLPSTCATLEDVQRTLEHDSAYDTIVFRMATDWMEVRP